MSSMAGSQHLLDKALPFAPARALHRSLDLELLYLPWAVLKPVGCQVPDGPMAFSLASASLVCLIAEKHWKLNNLGKHGAEEEEQTPEREQMIEQTQDFLKGGWSFSQGILKGKGTSLERYKAEDLEEEA